MLANLALGTLIISITVLIHTIGLVLLSRWMSTVVDWFKLHRHTVGRSLAMTTVVLGLFFIHTIEVWLWAVVFFALDMFEEFATALYFSTVTFSTVGYGDVTATPEWRLFASFEAIDGFILIGWSIAYLISASTRHGPFRIGEHF
jgi:voltage-gated potassium channel Kch